MWIAKVRLIIAFLLLLLLTMTSGSAQEIYTVYARLGVYPRSATANEDMEFVQTLVDSANHQLLDDGIELLLVDARAPITLYVGGTEATQTYSFGILGLIEGETQSQVERALYEISPLIAYDFQPRVTWSMFVESSSEPALPVQFLIAITYYSLNDCNTAENLFLTLLEQLDDNQENLQASIHFLIGNCSLLRDNYEEALEEFSTALSLTVSNVQPLLAEGARQNLAWLYAQNGNLETALSTYNIVFEADSAPYVRVYHLSHRAQLYALSFDYDSAIADMDAAIELAEANEVSDEQLAELYTLRGEIIFLIYEWDRVLENFNTALELAPDYPPAYFQRGVLYYTMTERENALADFQHYLEIAPDGEYAAEAQRYTDSIQLELESLGG
jgi:tetratricopeptide (TPR) repeat protein